MTSTHAELIKHNQNHFDEQSKKWDDDPEYVEVSRKSYAMLMEHLSQVLSREHTHVLNFGCGTGLLEAKLRHDVKKITSVDVSSGMIERVRQTIEQDGWSNVDAIQMDVLDATSAPCLPIAGFDLIASCFTFHHLQDVTKVGQALVKYLKPGGYFCLIEFAAEGEVNEFHALHEKMTEAARASLGSHGGFSKAFLVDFYETKLGLTNVHVNPACPLKFRDAQFSTVIAFGQKATARLT